MHPEPRPAHGPTPQPEGGFIGPYRVLAALGAGGVGQVYRVQDEIGRQLALKLLGRPGSQAKETRFAREGEVTASLTHPGIVRVHGWGTSHAGPYLVYELIEGQDFESCLPQLSLEQKLNVILQVADALGYAHSKGVVHRDVKPANVLVGADGRAWLADFGLAQAAGLERLTLSGALVGTPHYMSPEQALGQREHYGPPTDVWALGVLLYRVLTGKDPFTGSSMIMLLAQVTSETPDDPRTHNPEADPRLVDVCLRALEKSPEVRYPDGAAFAEDLRRGLGGESVIGRKPLRAARRSRTLRALALALLVLGLVGGGVFASVSRGPTTAATPTPAPAPERDPAPTVDPELGEQRALLAEVLTALDRDDAEAATDPLDRLRISALGTPERERLLWSEGVAALAAAESPAALERRLPLLRTLMQLPPAARDAETADAARTTYLGVLLAHDYLEQGNRARIDGDAATDRERVHASKELLERLADCGWRLRERDPGELVLNDLRVRWKVEGIAEDTYWWLLLSAHRLDFLLYPYDNFMTPDGHAATAERVWPWPESSRDPWKRYVELRTEIEARLPRDREALRPCLFDPEAFGGAGWSLGPRQWASAAICLASTQPQEQALELLRAAIEKDGESPEPHGDLADLFLRLGRPKDALDPSARALERFVCAYERDITRRNDYGHLLTTRLRVLVELDQREAAPTVYQSLQGIDRKASKRMLARYPWLATPKR